MTVSAVHEDPRKPTLPYTLKFRYGATESLVQVHRFPSPTMAEEARAMILTHRLDTSPWPTHFRP